jgi:hypothetical protein
MSSGTFDFAPLLPAGLPAPAAKWTGLAKYSFVGGNNDPDQVPLEGLIEAVNAVLSREGKTLATYGLASGLIATLETPLMPFWVWVAFQEIPAPRALVGGALVMGAVLADIVGDTRAQKR